MKTIFLPLMTNYQCQNENHAKAFVTLLTPKKKRRLCHARTTQPTILPKKPTYPFSRKKETKKHTTVAIINVSRLLMFFVIDKTHTHSQLCCDLKHLVPHISAQGSRRQNMWTAPQQPHGRSGRWGRVKKKNLRLISSLKICSMLRNEVLEMTKLNLFLNEFSQRAY